MEEYKRRQQISKAFTLVELVIAISLFVILSTISFIYFFKEGDKARDSVRVTDVRNLEKALEMYSLNKGDFPEPFVGADSSYLDSSGELRPMWKQGLIEERFIEELEELNKVPRDPLTGAYYLYSKASSTNEYQILVGYEKLSGSYFLPEIGAANSEITNQQVEGNYNGYYLKAKKEDEVVLLGVPTIMTGNISENKVVVDGEDIPVKLSGENTNTNFTLTELGDKMPTEDVEVVEFVDKLKQSYLSGELDGVANYDILDNLDPKGTPEQVEESINFGRMILGTSSGIEEVTVNPCYDNYGVKTLHGALPVAFWSRIGVSFDEIHSSSKDCDSYKKEFTCNNGTREEFGAPADTSVYKHNSCINGLPDNCLANTINYTHATYGNFITNHPDKLHNESTQNTITQDYNHGNYDFIFSSLCFNGSFINHNISRDKLNSCEANYHSENNMDCISNTRVCNTALGSGTETRSNGSRGACVLTSCISGYHLEGGQCLPNTKDCTADIPNALDATQVWNFGDSSRGECSVNQCKWGYILENNACPNAIVFEDTFVLIGQSRVYKGIDKRITFEKDDVSRDLLKIVNTNDNSEQIWMASNMGANEPYEPNILGDLTDEPLSHKNSFSPDSTHINNVGKLYQWGNNYGIYSGDTFNTYDGQIDCSSKNSSDFNNFYKDVLTTRDYCLVENSSLWGEPNTRAVCPQGYRLPNRGELENMQKIVTGNSTGRQSNDDNKLLRQALKIPLFGNIYSNLVTQGNWTGLRAYESSGTDALILGIDNYGSIYLYSDPKNSGLTVRCIYTGIEN